MGGAREAGSRTVFVSASYAIHVRGEHPRWRKSAFARNAPFASRGSWDYGADFSSPELVGDVIAKILKAPKTSRCKAGPANV